MRRGPLVLGLAADADTEVAAALQQRPFALRRPRLQGPLIDYTPRRRHLQRLRIAGVCIRAMRARTPSTGPRYRRALARGASGGLLGIGVRQWCCATSPSPSLPLDGWARTRLRMFSFSRSPRCCASTSVCIQCCRARGTPSRILARPRPIRLERARSGAPPSISAHPRSGRPWTVVTRDAHTSRCLHALAAGSPPSRSTPSIALSRIRMTHTAHPASSQASRSPSRVTNCAWEVNAWPPWRGDRHGPCSLCRKVVAPRKRQVWLLSSQVRQRAKYVLRILSSITAAHTRCTMRCARHISNERVERRLVRPC
ncbi:hypothetical protein C2E23DRAFT_92112 [Lenzites betulinus]|nr:hypothetical protein C2E23DRAFT_92112 [Lenzites betulinus]